VRTCKHRRPHLCVCVCVCVYGPTSGEWRGVHELYDSEGTRLLLVNVQASSYAELKVRTCHMDAARVHTPHHASCTCTSWATHRPPSPAGVRVLVVHALTLPCACTQPSHVAPFTAGDISMARPLMVRSDSSTHAHPEGGRAIQDLCPHPSHGRPSQTCVFVP
jgi:hypothetical protein